MNRERLDKILVERRLAPTRSRAEDLIKRGFVSIDGKVLTKPGLLVDAAAKVAVRPHASFVSRAGEKLYSVVRSLELDFKNKIVLDVGSSTGGFSEVCLKLGAKKVIAVEVGTEQMHPGLLGNLRLELHEKTDIRSVHLKQTHQHNEGFVYIEPPDVVVADVSFISLREILPHIAELINRNSQLVVMVKPQFEAATVNFKHKGVIKNDRVRRAILKDFELWAKQLFVIEAKVDSGLAGAKGNLERFYKLRKL